MRQDNFEFQCAGDICENCQERWENAKKPPIKLVALPSYTMRYHSPVAICPYCDGQPIRALAAASVKRREINAIG
jgi:hypothetical protein